MRLKFQSLPRFFHQGGAMQTFEETFCKATTPNPFPNSTWQGLIHELKMYLNSKQI